MKRFLMSSVAAGMALSLIGAPLAMAQQDQSHGPQSGQHEENHAAPQHATVQHTTVQHVAVQHQTVQHETVQHTTISHPPVQMSHEQNHSAPPMQHQASGGGHQWHSGDHYTGSRTYVSNYSAYHLNAPPAGYQWVQDGSQFVLIAVATGVITSVILNSVYQ